MNVERNDDDETLEELGRALGHDPSRTPPPDRVAALRAAAQRMKSAPSSVEDGATRARTTALGQRPARRMFLAGGIAAGVGGIAGYLAGSRSDEPDLQADAPVEDITFEASGSVESTAGLVNHTWGTELLLDVTGLEAGTTYDVVFRTASGASVAAGSLLAVDDVLMVCRFNAATLRADVDRILVREPGGDDVLSVQLPARDA